MFVRGEFDRCESGRYGFLSGGFAAGALFQKTGVAFCEERGDFAGGDLMGEKKVETLDYGLPGPIDWRRRLRIWVITAVAILASVFAPLWISWVGEEARAGYWDLRLYYLQRQSLAHPVSGGKLVYSSGLPTVAIASPEVSRFFGAYWKLWTGTTWTTSPNMATIYVGQRQAKNGLRRYVVVAFSGLLRTGQGADYSFPLVTRPLRPASLNSDPRSLTVGGSFGWGSSALRPVPEVMIYSAVEDSGDLSHFSYSYDVNIWHNTVDCWLQPDGHVKSKMTQELWFITPQGMRGGVPAQKANTMSFP
jgi:hypothetical protein